MIKKETTCANLIARKRSVTRAHDKPVMRFVMNGFRLLTPFLIRPERSRSPRDLPSFWDARPPPFSIGQ
jgi:hypothetical protein